MNYKTDLDYDLLQNHKIEELLQDIKNKFVSERFISNPNYFFMRRFKMLQAICNMLRIVPSNEQWYFLLTDADRLLCEACAGAGKTTMAQLKLVDAKLSQNIPGLNILALAYNNHAVNDMVSRHDQIIQRINNLKVPGLSRDRNICCHTFHSFCMSWVQDYPDVFNIDPKKYLLADSGVHEAMRFAAETYSKKNPDLKLFIGDNIVSALISLYNFAKETLTMDDVDAWNMCSSISELSSLSIQTIVSIFNLYDNLKRIKRKMDFTDVIEGMYTLCKKPEVMRRLRANYKIMLVDEYQDITPIMLRVIHIFMEGDPEFGIEPYYDGQLICIGDGDQSIYGFRGTDPDNCIRFRHSYEREGSKVVVTSMSENRRCPSNIIDAARKIIESNDRRIEKPIRSIRDGGEIKIKTYISQEDQMNQLISALRSKPQDSLASTCVCYRNLSSSYMLTVKLAERGIPFRIGRGNMPLTDKLSQSIFEVLDMLSYPDNLTYVGKALYKVLPKSAKFTKATITAILEDEERSRKNKGDIHRFWELNFPEQVWQINRFEEALMLLKTCYMMHRKNESMSDYVPHLIKLINLYYLSWQMQKGPSLGEEYMQYIEAWFSRSISYDSFMLSYKKLQESLKENTSKGVYITTLHGLKGLEFDDVHVIDLSDAIFPGTELNISKNLTQAQKDILENEARRLFYVTITRTRLNLSLYFNAEDPTRYVRYFRTNEGIANTYDVYLADASKYTTEGGFIVAKSEPADTSVDNQSKTSVSDIDAVDDMLLDDSLLSGTDLEEGTQLFSETFPPLVEEALTQQKQEEETSQSKINVKDKASFTKIMYGEGSVQEMVEYYSERDAKIKQDIGESNYRQIESKDTLKCVIDYLSKRGQQ